MRCNLYAPQSLAVPSPGTASVPASFPTSSLQLQLSPRSPQVPQGEAFQGLISLDHIYRFPQIGGVSLSTFLFYPWPHPSLQVLPFHSLLLFCLPFARPKELIPDFTCCILTRFTLLSRSRPTLLLARHLLHAPPPDHAHQNTPPPAPPPPHLQLALEDLCSVKPLATAPQLFLQAWQAARPLPQCLCLLAVELCALGLSGQRLGLGHMVWN